MIELRLLGALELIVDGRPVRLAGRPATTLAMLALDADRVVGAGRLIDALWDMDPPSTARQQIPIQISTIRKACGDPGGIETTPHGYRLDASAVRVDLRAAEALIDQARRSRSTEAFEEAFALWRGPVLDGLGGTIIQAATQDLEERRLTVLEEWAELALTEGGDQQRVLAHLARAVAGHPLRETLRALHMEALWRSGRQADALACYREGHRLLADELGVEPGRPLRELHGRILREEVPSSGSVRLAPGRPIVSPPNLLPPPIPAFTGRDDELKRLDGLLAGREHLPMAVISGIAGVGKTALALRWAHRVTRDFPDGQLFADLRGYERGASPMTSHEVLELFLHAMGVPGSRIPVEPEERAGLFRTKMRGRRVLMVLDNVASTAQVRPLLPGGVGCCVIVTARRRLEGLVAAHDALVVPVEVFDESETSRMLARVLGEDRVQREPDAALELARLCEGLPLAVGISAARLATRPSWTLVDLVDRLGCEQDRLDQLHGEDVQVRSGFELSYRDVPPRTAQAFRRLGLVDAPAGFASWLLAALMGDPVRTAAEGLMEELVDSQLLHPLGVDGAGQHRYRFHDLIRIFARERAEAEDTAADREAALVRAYGALLALSEEAERRYHGVRLPRPRGTAARWLPEGDGRLLNNPMGWLDAERPTVGAAMVQLEDAGWSELSWDLTVAVWRPYIGGGYRHDLGRACEKARRLCRDAGDRRAEAAVALADVEVRLMYGEIAEAARLAEEAARVFEELGEGTGVALGLNGLGVARRIQGDWAAAHAAFDRAVEIAKSAGNGVAGAQVHYNLGVLHLHRDRLSDAEATADRGLALLPDHAHADRALLHLVLAEARLLRGHPTEALELSNRVLAVARKYGCRLTEARSLRIEGEARLAMGDQQRGMAVLRRSAELADLIGDKMIEGRALLAMGLHSGQEGPVRAAAEAFAKLGSRGWHARALAALEEHSRTAPDSCGLAVE